ncbi:SDR family oxidoreductase [Mesorhizobium sp. ES1-1]|uniref:SDR family oxidoreductase n=1 Tax=Mesorhizobium sp. ES1-1 TaxID=2876629 RepID=UPI001CCBB35E|nr:SDR family oxidoreductase [Mesorhizobium sp. ES1-1]MBZ9676287.1 SDR family oxidoreductase [Mesorhizobium sp. ES1-1]
MPQGAWKPMRGKVMAVTGAASGIGREIARVFAQAGAAVATLDINDAALASLAQDHGCTPYQCDVTDAHAVKRVLESVASELGGLDILVSNAGSAQQGAIGDLPMEELRRSFELNFFGHQNACQAAIQIFRRQGRGGSILFNISNQSVNPGKDFGPYGIPKAATLALMKQYAVDHGREGIRANGINAGRIRSGLMTDQMIVERAGARGMTPHEYMAGNLLGVEVTASDIAEAFLHLAQLEKVNAAVLTVDGGVVATSLR